MDNVTSPVDNSTWFLKGPHTNRFFHSWMFGGGGKRTGSFQNFCFINISFENFLQGSYFYSFRLLYILLVRKNFDSSDSILSVFVDSGHRKHVADEFTII